MRNFFAFHGIFNNRKKCRKLCASAAALILILCLLSGCGPEPGREDNAGQTAGEAMFGDNGPAAQTGEASGAEKDEAQTAAEDSAAGKTAGVTTDLFNDTSSAGRTGAGPAGAVSAEGATEAGTAAAAKNLPSHPIQGEITQADAKTVKELEEYLNEDSSYGFLLSSYDIPEEIDLNQVFFSGAGFEQGDLTEEEEELLLDRIPQEKIHTPVVKVTDEQIEELLRQKAGITYEESAHPLSEEDGWVRINRYNARYALRGDTNRMYIHCSDAWQQEDLFIIHYQLTAQPSENEEETGDQTALYRPTYEVQLQKTEDGYLFCYNIFWMQKDMIEAQSYRAELKPVGEVFFAPFYPDTEKDEKADVTFALEQDRAVLAVLSPMEPDNIRTDRIFTGVDAVDFTDYNKDGFTDILTVCSYTRISEDGKKNGTVREARVYTGQEDSVPYLDDEKTEEVNRDVEVLNITNVNSYLTGKSDGTARKYQSWKEAFASHIEEIDEDEYEGFELIYLNEDRTPELVQVGATTAKGATVVIYRNGTLEERWLNRRDFQYLEYENLLYSSSGAENLHFDTIYSIVGGRLEISVQGYYGNDSFARVRFDQEGKESWDYYWDGGEVSENGYRDGIAFVFDLSRAKTCGGEGLMTAAELKKQLQ